MSAADITIIIRFAWWVRPYIHALAFFCALMGTKPDCDKLAKVIRRGTKCRVTA